MNKPTTNDLLPHEHQTRLLQVRGAGDMEFWEVGDVSAELADEAVDNGVKADALRRAIANLVGLSQKTVRTYEECSRFYPAEVRRKFPNLTRYHFRHAKITKDLSEAMSWLRTAEETADQYGGLPMPVDVLYAQLLAAGYSTSNGHVSNETYEWYTPLAYIEAARAVMGTIDLDPASCDRAQKSVAAGKYYTAADDGLAQPWFGNVWLNPPYNMPAIERFTTRAMETYSKGEIAQAVVLTNNATDTGWFHNLLALAGVAMLTKGRVKFWGPDGESAAGARQGQVVFYLGTNAAAFVENFRPFGVIIETK